MDDIFSFLTELASAPFRRLFTARGIAIILAAALSFAVYQIIVSSSFGEELNLRDLFPLGNPKKVTFYSGSRNGDYYTIVQDLKSVIEKNENFEIDNDPFRAAGFQNSINVWQNKNSFGFIQGQGLEKDDYILDNIDLIAPVYTEHLHIIVNKELVKNKIKKELFGNIEIGNNEDSELLRALLEAGRINIGYYGTGAMWIGSKIIDEWLKQIQRTDSKMVNYSTTTFPLTDAIDSLRNEKLGMVMFMMAPGLEGYDTVVSDTSLAIVNLSPEFVIKLRDESKLQIRPTTFDYFECKDTNSVKIKTIKSLGTFTYLGTGKKTDIRLVNKIIEGFVEVRREKKASYFAEIDYDKPICSQLKEGARNEKDVDFYFQLFFGKDSINFEDIFDDRMEEYRNKILKIISLFILSMLLSIIPLYIAMIWLFSGANYWKYLSKIKKKVLQKGVPNNIIPTQRNQLNPRKYKVEDDAIIDKVLQQNQDATKLSIPLIRKDQISTINNILAAISNIFKFRDETYSLLSNGGLTETHYTYLDREMDEAIEKLRKSLALRLHELIRDEKEYPFWKKMETKEKQVYLLKLTTADYLKKDEYDKLNELIEKQVKPPPKEIGFDDTKI